MDDRGCAARTRQAAGPGVRAVSAAGAAGDRVLTATARRLLKAAIEAALRRYGYRIINPEHRFGIDFITDTGRLARTYGVTIDLVIDVGANVGTMSLAFRAAWPCAAIHAFEPGEREARILSDHPGLTPPFVVSRTALGDRRGTASFYVDDHAPDLSSLLEQSPFAVRFGSRSRVSQVEVTTLDDYCERLGIRHVNVLKIDTEGCDHAVLVGAETLLGGRHIDFVYCEFNGMGGGEAHGSLLPIAELMSRHKYHFIASYNDYIVTEGRFFAVSNALFAADRAR